MVNVLVSMYILHHKLRRAILNHPNLPSVLSYGTLVA